MHSLLEDPEFVRIGNNVSTLKKLIAQIRRNKVIPFVGAGMSIGIYDD
jgi:hypothetical protein